MRDLIEKEMRGKGGARLYERLYVPKENYPQMSQQDLLYLALYQQLEKKAKEAAAQRAAREGGKPVGVPKR